MEQQFQNQEIDVINFCKLCVQCFQSRRRKVGTSIPYMAIYIMQMTQVSMTTLSVELEAWRTPECFGM